MPVKMTRLVSLFSQQWRGIDNPGKEFCESLFEKTETVPAFKPCNDCPGNCMSIKSLLCSSDPADATHSHPHSDPQPALSFPATNLAPGEIPGSTYTPSAAAAETDTMTCDQAWKTLKAHPNSRYASLSLLADVVAGRTVCTGPKPDSPASPLSISAGVVSPRAARQEIGVGARVNGTTGHAAGAATGGMAMVGGAGKKRNMAVETSAVRDALRLLDRTTPVSSPVPTIRVETDMIDMEPELKKRRIE